jgi:hypothetical protein
LKKSILLFAALALSLSACGSSQPSFRPGAALNPSLPNTVSANSVREKAPGPLIENRNVNVPRSGFDAIGEQNQNTSLPADPAFQSNGEVAAQSPFDTPFVQLPFETWRDLSDHIRYSNETTYEDRQFMNARFAEGHFNKYINTAFRDVRNLYKATPEEMKRFMLLDVLVNSLEVSGRALPYQDIHNPPAERHYKLFPTQAALLMPTFGEVVNYNRNSYDVNYVRWDEYRAARYYQANYSRIFGLIMEHGPSKRDAWRLVHREISSYAAL